MGYTTALKILIVKTLSKLDDHILFMAFQAARALPFLVVKYFSDEDM